MARQRRIGALDAETDPFKYGRTPKPFSWGLWLDDHYTWFWGDNCTEQLIEYLQDEKDLILYVHNGGKFDIHFLLEFLDQALMLINGRIAKCTLFDGQIELRDSWLMLPLPLASHEKDTIDYSKMERERREYHKKEILDYQKTDVYSLYKWVVRFIEQFGLNLTLAGTAFKELKKTDYEIGRSSETYDSTFRPFYYGGRVQCFEVGSFKGPIEYVDITSAYPWSMTFDHWYGTDYLEKLRISDDENGSYFANITAESNGALPFKYDDKLYFPDDGKLRRFKVSGWEVIAGLDTNTLNIKKVHRVYKPIFKKNFKEYVDTFFKMKHDAELANDATLRQFAKLMLNSCYGKFGQDGRKFEEFCLMEFGEWPEDKPDTPHDMRWKPYADAPGGMSYFSRPAPQHSFFNVATAASITGHVRSYLWRNICQSETPLYCDTDSIMCKKFHGSMSDKLGEWTLEARLNDVHIAQRKMYAGQMYKKEWPFIDYKIASKGVRFADMDDPNFKQESYESIKKGIRSKVNKTIKKQAPAFSLKYGARFFTREVNFTEYEKNACNNPPI